MLYHVKYNNIYNIINIINKLRFRRNVSIISKPVGKIIDDN